jgi:hypothetical protein
MRLGVGWERCEEKCLDLCHFYEALWRQIVADSDSFSLNIRLVVLTAKSNNIFPTSAALT